MFQSISRCYEFGYARSAAEALKTSHEDKFRQLPCRTFISVGACPYKERCVFLHDPRIASFESRVRTRNKNKEDIVLDAMFWPVLPLGLVNSKMDTKGQPHCIQQYNVPIPQNDEYQKHDEAVFSMWQHFVATCMITGDEYNTDRADINVKNFLNEEIYENLQTGMPRLDVFYSISNDLFVDAAAASPAPKKDPEAHTPSAPVLEPATEGQMQEFIEFLEEVDGTPEIDYQCHFEPISWAPLLQPYTPLPKKVSEEDKCRFTESPTDIASRLSPATLGATSSHEAAVLEGGVLQFVGPLLPLQDKEKRLKASELTRKIQECLYSLAELDEDVTMPGLADFLNMNNSLL